MPAAKLSSGTGTATFGTSRLFNGVKVFSATMMNDREVLGEKITGWLERNPQIRMTEAVVTQSSDEQFHCLAITVFYWEDRPRA